MTRADAIQRAKNLWGPGGFAGQQSDPERHRRFVVGVVLSTPCALGLGESYEAAFHAAEVTGYTPEFLAQVRKASAMAAGEWRPDSDDAPLSFAPPPPAPVIEVPFDPGLDPGVD